MRPTRLLVALVVVLGACGSNARYQGGPDLAMRHDLGGVDIAGLDINMGCATATHQAHQAPAAMLTVVDRSASMADNNKWTFAAQAVITANDQSAFDDMDLGLLVAPSGPVNAPQCVIDASLGTVTQVACGTPAFPQIAFATAGSNKHTASTGVRHDIYQYLMSTSPEVGDPDSTPLYDAIQTSIINLQGWTPQSGQTTGLKRILLVITDGSIDCAVFSSRTNGYNDCNMCVHEWENPQNIINMLSTAHADANAPVDTFIVGVPGADTFDSSACASPPYYMRAALSAMAYAGAPQGVPANCTGKTWTQATGNPTVSCHFDLTQGNFSAATLASTISKARGASLGCVFELPALDGGVPDLSNVNVQYSVGGGPPMDLFKRADPNNQCTTSGCWDYTNGNEVLLVGKACDDVKAAADAEVQIILGCATVIG
jgi:hypothetical protein